MDQVKEWINTSGIGGGQVIENILITIAALIAARWIGNRLRKRTIAALHSRSYAVNEATLLGRLVSMIAYGVAILITLIAWGVNSTGLFTALGIITVALGIALQDLFRNFFAGVLLLLEKPFQVGDYLSLRRDEGEVLGVDTRATRLRAPNGSTVLIPNFFLYSEVTTVRSTRGTRRVDLQITGKGVSAIELLETVEKAAQNTGMVKPTSGQPVIVSISAEETIVELSVLLSDGAEVRDQFVNAFMEQRSDSMLEVKVL